MYDLELLQVFNIKDFKGSVLYIGRRCGRWQASPLANPYKIGKDGDRCEVIAKYKKWLDQQIKAGGEAHRELTRIADTIARGEKINLGCWCKPYACHGDIVKEAVAEILNQRKNDL